MYYIDVIKGIKDGIGQAIHLYVGANNKYVKD